MSSSGANSKESSSKWSNPFKKQAKKVADAKPVSDEEKDKQAASKSTKKDGKERNSPPLVVPYFPTGAFLGRL